MIPPNVCMTRARDHSRTSGCRMLDAAAGIASTLKHSVPVAGTPGPPVFYPDVGDGTANNATNFAQYLVFFPLTGNTNTVRTPLHPASPPLPRYDCLLICMTAIAGSGLHGARASRHPTPNRQASQLMGALLVEQHPQPETDSRIDVHCLRCLPIKLAPFSTYLLILWHDPG